MQVSENQDALNVVSSATVNCRVDAEGDGHGKESSSQNRRSQKRRSYYPLEVNRAFFMCNSEVEIAEHLCDLIEKEIAENGSLLSGDPDGSNCRGNMKKADGTVEACVAKRRHGEADILRKSTLFTLNHGAIGVVLLDWEYSVCRYVNTDIGHTHGIFPARAGTAYIIELLYWWLHEIARTPIRSGQYTSQLLTSTAQRRTNVDLRRGGCKNYELFKTPTDV